VITEGICEFIRVFLDRYKQNINVNVFIFCVKSLQNHVSVYVN